MVLCYVELNGLRQMFTLEPICHTLRNSESCGGENRGGAKASYGGRTETLKASLLMTNWFDL